MGFITPAALFIVSVVAAYYILYSVIRKAVAHGILDAQNASDATTHRE